MGNDIDKAGRASSDGKLFWRPVPTLDDPNSFDPEWKQVPGMVNVEIDWDFGAGFYDV